MEDPSDIDDYSNWIGGFYELVIKVGPTDDTRLERMLAAVWGVANATGPFVRPDDGASRSTSLNLEALGQLIHGVVRLPSGSNVVCGAMAIREERGPDWLIFHIPLEALARTDRRVGGYSGQGDPESLVWRRPLDDWLAGLAIRAYAEVPFEFAMIGWEVFAFAEESAADRKTAERFGGYIATDDGVPHYYETRS